ncbi:MAG: hypothetical protein EXR69_15105 [Myxococcales bacterium]|nr:hypothetical protein [Myxococcales bacterium]
MREPMLQLLPVLALLGGCGTVLCGSANPDCFVDTGFDSSVRPAGGGLIFYAGEAQTSGGHFISGHFGYDFTDASGNSLCTALSQWTEGGGAVAGDCPDCEWSFNLSLANGEAIGDRCDEFEVTGAEWDGFTASWGFASTYEYETNGTIFTLDTVLLYYSRESGWFPLAYNYGSRIYNTGNASDFAFHRYYSYLYYYP